MLRWFAVALTIPVIFVMVTGIILQIRKPVDLIQPTLRYGVAVYQPTATLESILESVKAIPQMHVSGWKDIQLFDLRPKEGTIKVRTFTEMEAQVDAKTGAVLNVQKRWNDIIERIHEGSVWELRTSIFLISGTFMFILAMSGFYFLYRVAVGKIPLFQSRAKKAATIDRIGSDFSRPSFLKKRFRKFSIFLVPLLVVPWIVVTGSGLLLQVRYELPWVMPEQFQGISKIPSVEFVDILENTKRLKGLKVDSWENIWRVYVYPNKGNISLHTNDRWEVQFDAKTGELLDLSVRRTELIEKFHEGKWMNANIWFFLPAHIMSIIVWLLGVYLWITSPRRAAPNY